MTLLGKNVLITGAALRIGRSLALAAARRGANIIIHYQTSTVEAESLQAEIQALGTAAVLLQADLSDPAQATSLMEQAFASGTLYGLVNNASIFGSQTWENTSLEDWQRHMQVNLTTPFLLSQSFARLLPQGEHGRIVNLLDWRALRPGADHLPYTISKAALVALTQSLAVALAPRISVNGLALGAVLPPSDGGAVDHILKYVPAGRWAELDEVGQALLFLLEGPAYITGEIVHVDGGRHLV